MSTTYEGLKTSAEIIHAFTECDDETRGMLNELAAIVLDPLTNDDDRRTTLYTIDDLLFPGKSADFVEAFRSRLEQPDAIAAKAEVKAEATAFCDSVRARMKQLDWTQQQLADAAGIKQPAVANMLSRNCYPQARTVEKFAKAFGVEPVELWPHYEPATEQVID